MSDDQTTNPELREMVLSFAATIARKCADAVKDSCLSDGRLEDKTDAGGVEWHFIVVYDGDDDTVKITAHPHVAAKPELMGVSPLEHGIAMAFGMAPNQEAMEFNLPVAWLPEA
jgi:hypothetical protein